MKKELHFYYKDALKSAEHFAQENNASVARERTVNERSMEGCSVMDSDAEKLCWSGETSAIPVENENGQEIGLFAYWE